MRFPQLFRRNHDAAGGPAPAPRAGSTRPPPAPDRTPLAEADELVSAGRLVEAVDRLVQANRDVRDPEVEVRLRQLRHEAALGYGAGAGRPDWPPEYADPFPEVSGRPPEIDAAELDTDVLGGAVAHHGCLIVRRAFDEAQVDRTVVAIDRALAGRNEASDADEARRELDDECGDEWYWPLHLPPRHKNNVLRDMVANQGGLWLGDSPAATEQVLADLDAAGVVGAIAAHFGERPFFSLQKSTLRRSAPEHRLAAWHQDGSFLTPGVRTMNAWVALSRCGGDHPSPGLEVLPRRFHQVLPLEGVVAKHSISFELVTELAVETPTVVPEFEPGDAMLFDERLVHRTHLTEHMTEPRYAIECWFFAPSHQSDSYAPLLV